MANSEASFQRELMNSLKEYFKGKQYTLWKTNDSFTPGIPDLYFSAHVATFWCELKFKKQLPKNPTLKNLGVSPTQFRWNQKQYQTWNHLRGFNCFYLIGSPKEAVVVWPIYEYQEPFAFPTDHRFNVPREPGGKWNIHKLLDRL